MKQLLLGWLILICYWQSSLGQITIDTFKVYHRGVMVDSVYFGGTTDGQQINTIDWIPFNDICGTHPITLRFEGCATGTTTRFDTTMPFGYFIQRIYGYTVWDTSSTCPLPTTPIITDTVYWNICPSNPTNTTQLPKAALSLYPNPAHDLVVMTVHQTVAIEEVALYHLSGQLVRQFERDQTELRLQGLPKGLYVLKVRTAQGAFIEKLVIE